MYRFIIFVLLASGSVHAFSDRAHIVCREVNVSPAQIEVRISSVYNNSVDRVEIQETSHGQRTVTVNESKKASTFASGSYGNSSFNIALGYTSSQSAQSFPATLILMNYSRARLVTQLTCAHIPN